MDITYEPDFWRVVSVKGGYKVFGTWAGSYLSGAYWRLSSGVEKIKEEKDYYIIENVSGSIYKCHKDREGMHWYGAAVYNNWKEKDKEDVLKSFSINEIIKEFE